MNESDKKLDELYEALSIEKILIEPQSPPIGGYNASYFRWFNPEYRRGFHTGWAKYKGPSDIAYMNNDGKPHRLFGPSYISTQHDVEIWYKDGVIHREDGPAIRHKCNQVWIKDGLLHRLDGPAIIDLAGPKEFWIEGRKYSPKEYKKEIRRRHRKGLIK